MDKVSGRLLALWLLLIPLPVYLPLVELNYEPYFIQFSSFSLYPNQLIALFFIFAGIAWYRPQLDLKPLILSIPLIALCLLTLVGIWAAQVNGALSAIQLGRMLIALALFFALKAIPFNRNHLFQAVLIFLAVQGVAATLQYALQDDLGLRFLGEYDVEPLPGRGSIIFGIDEYWLRSYGLAPHPNILGGFAGSALCAAIFWWDWEDQAQPNWLVSSAIFFGTLAVLFPFSRSAWLGTGSGLALGFFLRFLMQIQDFGLDSVGANVVDAVRKITPMLLALIVFWLMASDAFLARSQPLPNETVTQSVGERELLRELSYDFISENRLIGIGANNFGPAMLDLPNLADFPSIHPVHHVPLLLSAELGLLGGATWLFLMGAPLLLVGWKVWQCKPSKWLLGCAMGLVVLAAVDLFDYYSWGWPHGLTWRWMWFALLASFITSESR